MKISVKGKNDILSKKHIRYVVKLFGKLVLSPRLYPNINVVVQSMRIDTWGYCGIADIEEKKPRSFEILLNPILGENKQIITLAHEMIHLKQLALGEFKSYDNGKYKWNGNIIEMTQDDYYKMPWEIEASTRENELFEEYKRQIKENAMQF
jgi:hypothetical protein